MKHLERQSGKAIDLLICCGDFQVCFSWLLLHNLVLSFTQASERYMQAVRNLDDLECLACPPKYRALNTFWKYYTGQATAPYPTLFSELSHLTQQKHICFAADRP